MTVEKSGQLAWTFEDLDLEGAYEILDKQIYDLCSKQKMLLEFFRELHSEKKFDIADYIEEKFDLVTNRLEKLFVVSKYLRNLMKGCDFNDKSN